METLKTAVIGTGSMGKNHARVYSELKNSELVAIADVDTKNRTIAEKLNCNFYKDYKEMLKKEKPDAISIAVPTNLHFKVGYDALKITNTLIEKPIADSVDDAEALIKVAKENETKLMIGHIERFNPVIDYLKDWITKNEAKYLAFNIVRVGPQIPPKIPIGVILDLAIHDIDIVRYLTKEDVLEVNSKVTYVSDNKIEDHAQIWLKLMTSSASIVANRISPRKIRHIYITLDKAFIYADYMKQTMVIYSKWDERLDPRLLWYPKKTIEMAYREPLKIELKAFLDCIEKNKEVPVTGEDALESLKVALKAEEIAKGGLDK